MGDEELGKSFFLFMFKISSKYLDVVLKASIISTLYFEYFQCCLE